MRDRPITNRTAHSLALLMVVGMAVQLLVVFYVFYSNYQGRANAVEAQRSGCERGKLDRSDNADFQRTQRDYIGKVVLAASVHEDVKRAAREAVAVFNRTSDSLWHRAQIDCVSAIPDASLFP